MAEVITINKLTEIINLQYQNTDTSLSSFDIFIKGFTSFMSGGFFNSINDMMNLYKKEFDKQQEENYEIIYDAKEDIERRKKMI